MYQRALFSLIALGFAVGGCIKSEQNQPPATPSTQPERAIIPTGDEAAPEKGEENVVFTGTVKLVELLGRQEATVYPVGVDPRFLLVVQVNSVQQNRTSPIAAEKTVMFAIHSPSRLFVTVAEPTGRKFRFTATWVSEGRKRFSWIEAWPEPADGK